MNIETSHDIGHFYSPIIDPEELRKDTDRIWPDCPTSIPGLDLNDSSHEKILGELFPKYIADFDYPERGPEDEELTSFYIQNSQFSWLDARLLFVLIRAWQPSRVIEVGSGYSTLLMSDINQRYLDGSTHITAIEPFPRPFLRNMAPQVGLLEKRVQEVSHASFEELGAGDILFIDSSHVAKTGSDVNYLYLEILPRLKPGVLVHAHDIFLPLDYPKDWVLKEYRSWNEQYLLQALLMFSSKFRVRFGAANAWLNHRPLLAQALSLPQEQCFGGEASGSK